MKKLFVFKYVSFLKGIIVVLLLLVYSCEENKKMTPNTFVINGFISGVESGDVKLYEEFGAVLAEASVKDGVFVLEGDVTALTEAYITINNTYEVLIILEPKKVNLSIHTKNEIYRDGHIVGLKPEFSNSEINELFLKYLDLEDKICNLPEFEILNQWLNKDSIHLELTDEKILVKERELFVVRKRMANKIDSLRKSFVIENSHSPIAPYIISYEGNGFDSYVYSISEMKEILDAFSKKNNQSEFVKDCQLVFEKSKQFANRKSAPNFQLESSEGKIVSLDNFKGNYVLLHFLTPWCGICENSFPLLNTLNSKYKKEGLEIIGISDDPEIESWKKYLIDHQLNWTQLIINQNSDVPKKYNLSALPSYYLIDQSGKVLVQTLEVFEIEQILEHLFKDSKN